MVAFQTGLQALRRGLALFPRDRTAPETPAGRNGARIAVIGNCQARGVARSLEVLLPNATVTLIAAGRLGNDTRSVRAFAEQLASYDHVFSQPFPSSQFPNGGAAELADLFPRARLFPAIVFTAFHPDMVYVGNIASGAEAAVVPSPLHTYHSAITLFGYLRGLSAERIATLFREEVFIQLGFLDIWGLAADDLSRTSRAVGFDLGPDLLRWSRRGAFMHGINHPKLFVMADIARRLAAEAGLSPASLPIEDYLVDDLLDEVIWPVYPPVATAFGVSGSYVFKRRAAPKTPGTVLGLESFIAESLAIYRATPRERLACHRTDHWSGIPEIRALFDAA